MKTTYSDDINITGKVVDARDSALSEVKVQLLKNGDTTSTDTNGDFSIIGVTAILPDDNQTLQPITHVSYSPLSGMLSFSILTNATPVTIDIFTCSGRHMGSVLNKKLDRGTYQLHPLVNTHMSLSSSIYFIKLQAGTKQYVFKGHTLYISYDAEIFQSLKKPVPKRTQTAKDTLVFIKDGYQTKKVPLDTLITNVGSITVLGYPLCTITSPAAGAAFHFGDSLVITADASDRDGETITTAVSVDNELFFTDSIQPYSCVWNTIRNTIGNRTITVTAADAHGLSTTDSVAVTVSSDSVITYTYDIINRYNHDDAAYTQGLVYENGVFYESTGLYGSSTLRKVEIETGNVLQNYALLDEYFGEGMVIWDDRIIQLTWKENIAFVYDKTSFAQTDEFINPHDGWGITHDGNKLILSDGSEYLYFRDPETYTFIDSIPVMQGTTPVLRLNELEYFYHKVFANVYQTNDIVMIDLPSGSVLGRIDCTDLLISSQITSAGVLNGIAYAKDNDRIFLTGKLWPTLFEVKLVRK